MTLADTHMIDTMFNVQDSILFVRYSHQVDIDELEDVYNDVANSYEYPRELDILIDERGCDYVFAVERVKKLQELIAKAAKKYTYMRIAYLQDNAHQIVYSILLSRFINSIENVDSSVFTTVKASLQYLNRIPISIE